MDGDFSEQTGKVITLVVTFVSMGIGFTLIPLLPAPLPFIVAFLVAWATYKDKWYGMMSGRSRSWTDIPSVQDRLLPDISRSTAEGGDPELHYSSFHNLPRYGY